MIFPDRPGAAVNNTAEYPPAGLRSMFFDQFRRAIPLGSYKYDKLASCGWFMPCNILCCFSGLPFAKRWYVGEKFNAKQYPQPSQLADWGQPDCDLRRRFEEALEGPGMNEAIPTRGVW